MTSWKPRPNFSLYPPVSTPQPEIAARPFEGTSVIGAYRFQSPATSAKEIEHGIERIPGNQEDH